MRMVTGGSGRGERVRRRRDAAAAARPPATCGSARSRPPRTPAPASARVTRTCSPLADRSCSRPRRETLAGHDVVFLALPHGASAALAAQLPDDVVVVDCGADFRLDDAAGLDRRSTAPTTPGPGPTGCPSCRCRVGAAAARRWPARTRVAVPGCYPTACSLALAPGFAAGLLEPDGRRDRRRHRHLRRRPGRSSRTCSAPR